MISYISDAVKGVKPKRFIVVVSKEAAHDVQSALGKGVEYVVQDHPLGTGHAVQASEATLKDFDGTILIICGDTPLVAPETLKELISYHEGKKAAATILTAKVSNPQSYGRIIRGDGGIKKIVEDKDATLGELYIREVNTGTYCFDAGKLFTALNRIKPTNVQKEYYLTDVIAVFNEQHEKVVGKQAEDEAEVLGVNSRIELADAEMILRARINEELMAQGVTLIHPPLTYIDADVKIGKDTVIYPLTFLKGKTSVGRNCQIGPSCQIIDSKIGDDVEASFAVLNEVRVENGACIGHFSNLRPGTKVGEGAKVGSFVEVKKSTIGKGSKVSHLSYIGDATVGKGVNIGAGTITCNFDGVKKHLTVIEDNAFVGSDTILVAPVKVGKGAYTGAGSIISKDVPPDSLGIERTEQKNIKDWAKGKSKSKNQKGNRER